MKIGFCGSMSVGKSTLVKELAKLKEFKNYNIFTERSKYLNDLGIPLNTDSTLFGQTIFAAERSRELMNENFITDRTIIDVIAFTNLAKSIERHEKLSFEHLFENFIHKYDYLFYIPSEGLKIEDNGVRETDKQYRDNVDYEIRSLYETYLDQDKRYIIKGSTEKRIKKIKEIIFS